MNSDYFPSHSAWSVSVVAESIGEPMMDSATSDNEVLRAE